MRIVRKAEKEIVEAYKSKSPETRGSPPDGKTVEFGKEDIILAIIIGLLILAYAQGQLTIQEVLAYLGVTTSGGVWGLIGGASSTK